MHSPNIIDRHGETVTCIKSAHLATKQLWGWVPVGHHSNKNNWKDVELTTRTYLIWRPSIVARDIGYNLFDGCDFVNSPCAMASLVRLLLRHGLGMARYGFLCHGKVTSSFTEELTGHHHLSIFCGVLGQSLRMCRQRCGMFCMVASLAMLWKLLCFCKAGAGLFEKGSLFLK